MTAFPNYAVGTVAIGAGATTVVGSGTLWTGVNARPGDCLIVAGHQVIIQDVTDANDLVIDAWPFAAVVAGTAYKIVQNSPLRFAGGQAMADVSAMIAALNTDGWYRYVAPSYSDPTAQGLTAADGQYAFQASTGKLWIMTGGAWSFVGIYKGLSPKGAWSSVTAYAANDIVSLAGSSYLCTTANTNQSPPNATYWQILASIGNTGPTTVKPVAPWITATVYVIGPPADYVSINGSSYQCLVAHTSGVFATDLAAGKWGLIAQKGTDALQYGGTSVTSFTIGLGSKAFTTQAGLAYLNGARVRASSNATPTNWIEGVSTYAGTTLTITVDKTNGTATAADWNFNLVGQPGAGDLSSANNLSDVASKITAKDNLSIHGADIASAATLNLETATGDLIDVTGTTTITAITLSDGHSRTVRFTGILTLTNGASLVLPGNANILTGAGDFAIFRGYGAGVVRCVVYSKNSPATSIIRGYLAGLTLSTAGSSSTFAVAAGVAADSTNADMMALAASISKTTGAWAVGSGNGALDAGTIAANTWYHVYEIKRPDTGVVDVCVSLSATAPTTGGNIPSAYTLFRRIGSMKTNGSSQWIKFIQTADKFMLDIGINDVSATNPGTAAVTRTLSTPPGVVTEAIVCFVSGASAAADDPAAVWLNDLATGDAPVVGSGGVLSGEAYNNNATPLYVGGLVYVNTNTSQQIRSRVAVSGSTTTLSITTIGWNDTRGRFA